MCLYGHKQFSPKMVQSHTWQEGALRTNWYGLDIGHNLHMAVVPLEGNLLGLLGSSWARFR